MAQVKIMLEGKEPEETFWILSKIVKLSAEDKEKLKGFIDGLTFAIESKS